MITKEMLQLTEEITRGQDWQKRVGEFMGKNNKQYKELAGLVGEYNNLLLKDNHFENTVDPLFQEA